MKKAPAASIICIEGEFLMIVYVKDESNVGETLRNYTHCFGMHYLVYHGAEPHNTVVYNTLLAPSNVKIDMRESEVSVWVNAYDGAKGNKVQITIPFDGLAALAAQVQQLLAAEKLREHGKKKISFRTSTSST
jgi:hypothetical protein